MATAQQMTNDSTKGRILLAAGPVFARKGFRAATVREICAAAKVNVASINYYFGDKQTLYTQTLLLAREMRSKQVPFPEWQSDTPAEQKLHDFVRLLLNRIVAMKSEPWQVRLLLREVMQPTSASNDLIESYFRPMLNQLLSIVDELVGESLPFARRHQLAFSIIGQCMHYRVSAAMIARMIPESEYRDNFDIDHLTDHIWNFSMGALDRIRASSDNDPNTLSSPQSASLHESR